MRMIRPLTATMTTMLAVAARAAPLQARFTSGCTACMRRICRSRRRRARPWFGLSRRAISRCATELVSPCPRAPRKVTRRLAPRPLDHTCGSVPPQPLDRRQIMRRLNRRVVAVADRESASVRKPETSRMYPSLPGRARTRAARASRRTSERTRRAAPPPPSSPRRSASSRQRAVFTMARSFPAGR